MLIKMAAQMCTYNVRERVADLQCYCHAEVIRGGMAEAVIYKLQTNACRTINSWRCYSIYILLYIHIYMNTCTHTRARSTKCKCYK